MNRNFRRWQRQTGFTLIEVMMVVVIVGILLLIALPSYRNQVIKGNRAAAQAQMMDIGNREQQFLLANRTYTAVTAADLSSGANDLGYGLPDEVDSYYDCAVTIGGGTVPSYTITCTATGDQAADGNLTLTSDGTKTPADKWD